MCIIPGKVEVDRMANRDVWFWTWGGGGVGGFVSFFMPSQS